jgi:hypothetical protein
MGAVDILMVWENLSVKRQRISHGKSADTIRYVENATARSATGAVACGDDVEILESEYLVD